MIPGYIIHIISGTAITVAEDGDNPSYHDLLFWLSYSKRCRKFHVTVHNLEGDIYEVSLLAIKYIEPISDLEDGIPEDLEQLVYSRLNYEGMKEKITQFYYVQKVRRSKNVPEAYTSDVTGERE